MTATSSPIRRARSGPRVPDEQHQEDGGRDDEQRAERAPTALSEARRHGATAPRLHASRGTELDDDDTEPATREDEEVDVESVTVTVTV